MNKSARLKRSYLHFSYSCASPFGPILVTHDPNRTLSCLTELVSAAKSILAS